MLLAAEVQRWDLDSWPKDALHARQRAIREPFTVRLSQRQLNVTAAIIFYTSAGRVQKFPCIVIEQ